MAQIHKNNKNSEMILDEFMWYMVLVCTEKKKRRSAGQSVEGIAKLVRQFYDEEILAKAPAAGMPLSSNSLKSDVGRKPTIGHYDGIAREEQEIDLKADLGDFAAHEG